MIARPSTAAAGSDILGATLTPQRTLFHTFDEPLSLDSGAEAGTHAGY
jgi:hypothetical protein